MENQAFDELSRNLGTLGSRRGVIAALAGLLGAGLFGADHAMGDSKQQRRRQRRRNKQDRRSADSNFLRGCKFNVLNPLDNPDSYVLAVEFGDVTPAPHLDYGLCCQSGKTAQVDGGEQSWFATKDSDAYLWVDNKYFIYAVNPTIGLPMFHLTINGANTVFRLPSCCKPAGTDLESNITLDVGETKVLDFEGRHITVTRNADEDDYKSYNFIMHV